EEILLYGAIAWASEKPYTADWTLAQEIQHCKYLSKFHKSFSASIQNDSISECHFFALFFVIMVAEGQELVVYTKGILAVLQMLNERKTSNFTQQPLRYLYQFALKFLRVYRSHKWAKLEPALLLELQQAQEECPSPELIRDFRVPVGRFS